VHTITDAHSPREYRINGVVVNVPALAAALACIGKPMVREKAVARLARAAHGVTAALSPRRRKGGERRFARGPLDRATPAGFILVVESLAGSGRVLNGSGETAP
jgi:hypothetical protein